MWTARASIGLQRLDMRAGARSGLDELQPPEPKVSCSNHDGDTYQSQVATLYAATLNRLRRIAFWPQL